MKQKTYDAVLEVLSRHTFFHTGLAELQTKLPVVLGNVNVKTLRSIQAQYYVRRMKRTAGRHYYRKSRERYYELYKEAKEKNEDHIIIRLALKNDLSPCLLARIILEEYYWNDVEHGRHRDKPDGAKGACDDDDDNPFIAKRMLPAGLITDLLRDIDKIPNPFLVRELYESMVVDNFYGPLIDSIKRCCGNEYEVQLKSQCLKAGLTFIDEDQMRRDGYDKTPDIRLKIPCMINNRVVNWIESKASFGDPANHQQYMMDQLLPYRNRFGEGVVIYWFGFVDELVNDDYPGIQILDGFPPDSNILRFEDALKKDNEKWKDGSFAFYMKYMRKPIPKTRTVDTSDPFYNYVDPMFSADEEENLVRQFGLTKLKPQKEEPSEDGGT